MSLKDAIGQALSDTIAENPTADFFDAREIDRLADVVLAVLHWETFARHTDVVSRELSDGSMVYDVLLRLDDGARLRFICPDLQSADKLCIALRAHASGLEYDR